MKNILKIALTSIFALTLTVSFAQTKKAAPAKTKTKPTVAQAAPGEKKGWAELQAFHEVMSKSFHPTEEGNFEPLKANATLLLEKAKMWMGSPIPANFEEDRTREVLNRLTVKCQEVNEAVTSGADNGRLKVLITEAHEIFHELVEKCRKPEEGSKEQGDKK